MRFLNLFSVLLLFFLSGCEQSSQPPEQTTAAPKAVQMSKVSTGSGLFHQPITPQLLELPDEALAYWRTAAVEKPALVLFSFDPLLKPIPSSLQQQARKLALTGSPQQLRQHGSINTAEPLILPTQTVTAALDAGMFSKLYWIFPSKVPPEQLDLAKFRSQLLEKKIITAEEAAGINLLNGVYTGQIRGVPFEAVHYQRLRDIAGPLVLHIDTGFFRGLYDNEIKTPLYNLLRDTVDSLRKRNWQPSVTTLSYSTAEGAVSLDVRFVISNLAELMQNPARLDGDMPKEWQLRSEALYAGDMYSQSKQQQLAQQLVQVAPNSAAAHYDRFQALFLDKRLEPALQALQRAVALDPGYAAAYLQLARIAAKEGKPNKALELLTPAEKRFPEYPFIPLQKAQLLTDIKQYAAAEKYLSKLPQQWSPIYHAKIPAVVTALQRRIAEGGESE